CMDFKPYTLADLPSWILQFGADNRYVSVMPDLGPLKNKLYAGLKRNTVEQFRILRIVDGEVREILRASNQILPQWQHGERYKDFLGRRNDFIKILKPVLKQLTKDTVDPI